MGDMKKGIIFDMDGTLWDSAEQVAKSWNVAAAGIGYEYHLTAEDIMAVSQWTNWQNLFLNSHAEKIV